VQLELFNKEELQIKEGESKVCIDCNLEKHVSAFPPYKRNADNLDNRCRRCISENAKIVEEIRKTAPEKPEKCDCCGKVPPKRFVLDHCHETRVFRGWLCDHCNLAIGLLGDDVKGVTKALDYLKEGNLTLGAT
tara:strand:+ start:103 stop:504 length:402 start_codon:yes stop_codon:yes gene_type:complete